MKIVMFAVVAALLAAPACAEAADLVYHPPIQQHHVMPPPRPYFRPSMRHERFVPEYRRARIERPIFVQRRHYGRDRFYGLDANGNEDLGEGERFQTHVYRHWERHERHRVVHFSAPRAVSRDCDCGCCCGGRSLSSADPPEYVDAGAVDVNVGYVPPGFHIVHE